MENSSVVKPIDIKQNGPLALEINWSDAHKSVYSTYELRLGCRCAHCVDEWSGKLRLEKNLIPKDIHPLTLEGVGRYGIKINWSDGHSTGIYSFDYLRKICPCDVCKNKVEN